MAIDGAVDTLKIEIQTTGVAKAQKQLNSLVGTLKTFKRLNQTMTGVGETAKEAGENVKDASQDIATAGETIEVTGEKAGRTSATLKKVGASFRSAGKDGEKSTGLFARLGDSFKKTTSHIASFASALKRIAMYRFLRSVIKAITAAIGEGITNIYNYSRTVGTTLAPALDRAKSATLTFKNSIGAALAPVLEALIPVLVRVCNWLTTFNNLLAAIFAGLSGKSSYTAAVAATATWGDNLKSAAGSAKELKRQLLGFDELNVLNDPSSGGGGGGGASTPDYASMFEERAVPQGMFDWMQDFKLVFNDVVLDWSNINGEQLAEKIISGLFTVAGLLVGGVPGAVVGFLLSLFVNKYLFNQDGKLDAEEIAAMVVTGLMGLSGAIAGGLIGGVPGAIIGFSLGVLLSMGLTKAIFDGDGILSKEETIMLITTGLCGISGGFLGFMVGGVPGMLIGFSLGVILSLSLEGIYQQTTGHKDPVKAWLYKLIGKEYSEDGVDVDVNVVPNIETVNTSSVDDWLSDLNITMNNGGKEAASSFYTGYEKTAKKERKTRSATENKYWNDLNNDAIDILSGMDINKGYTNINNKMNNGMRLIKDGDRSRWVSETEYVTQILKSTDVTTPFTVMNTSMQNEWNSIKTNTDSNAGQVVTTIGNKFGGININPQMNKIQSDLGTHFTSMNSFSARRMTEVSDTIADKIRSTDIATPLDSLKTTLSTKFGNMHTESETKTNDIATAVSNGFTTLDTNGTSSANSLASNVSSAFTTLQTGVQSAMNTLQTGIATPFNAISNGAADMCENVVDAVIEAMEALNKAKFTVPTWVPDVGGRSFSFNATVPAKMTVTPELMASGGLVESGQLFIARENGPEIVASYGSKSSVMNNDQIVESVSEGVYQAVVSALGNQSTTINVDGRQLFEIVTERNNAQVRRTGKSPLLT